MAAGVPLRISAGEPPTGPGTEGTTLLITDAQGLDRMPRAEGMRSRLAVLIPDGSHDVDVWRAALTRGASAVVSLPSQSDELLALLTEHARPRRSTRMIGIVAGCGGAGASSFAARLAAAARAHGPVVLVDADPTGGGLDTLIEAPPLRGVSWTDIAATGSTDADALRESLPQIDDVRLLCTHEDGPTVDEASLDRALAALSLAGGAVVVDLAPTLVPAAAAHLDELLLLSPCSDHAVRAAQRRQASWRGSPLRSGLVVRRRGDLHPQDVAADLRLPLLGTFRDSPGAVPLLDVRRGGADRLCRQLLKANR